MRRDLPALAPLVCPRCRVRTAEGREMHTVSLVRPTPGSVDAGAEVREGELRCDNPACGAVYPIVDGVPILVSDVAALRAGQAVALEAGAEPAALAARALAGPDDAPLPRLLDHLSVYLDAHFGDRADPPPDGPVGFGFAALAEKLAALPGRARHAVELGCSVGRGLLSLAAGADRVVGVELHVGAARAARALVAGEALPYLRRGLGRHYQLATIAARPPPAGTGAVAVVCGDALDPPLAPGHFDRVVALNLLDSVRSPGQLLSVADGLLEPGGQLVLSCPYAFQSDIVDDAARPDAADPAEWLRGLLQSGRGLEAPYAILEDSDVDWALRRDARSTQHYRTHFVVARKG